jgi:hypothetical protein
MAFDAQISSAPAACTLEPVDERRLSHVCKGAHVVYLERRPFRRFAESVLANAGKEPISYVRARPCKLDPEWLLVHSGVM